MLKNKIHINKGMNSTINNQSSNSVLRFNFVGLTVPENKWRFTFSFCFSYVILSQSYISLSERGYNKMIRNTNRLDLVYTIKIPIAFLIFHVPRVTEKMCYKA